MSKKAIEAAYKEAAKFPADRQLLADEMLLSILRIRARAAVEKANARQLIAAIRAMGGE